MVNSKDIEKRGYVPPKTPEPPPVKKPGTGHTNDGYVPPKNPIPPPHDKKK